MEKAQNETEIKWQPINPNPGNNKDPKNFVGRVEISSRACEMLDAGQDILISDPRRTGKTFWMKTFKETEQKYRFIYIDYQGSASSKDFLSETVKGISECLSLPEKFKKNITNLFDFVEVEAGIGVFKLKTAVKKAGKSEMDIMENLLTKLDEELENQKDERPLVIEMDEVPDALIEIAEKEGKEGKEDALILMQKLQKLRRSSRNIRWIIAGSIGFHHVLNRIGTTTAVLSGLNTLKFGPLKPEEAKELVSRLALGINRKITDDVAAEIVKETDGFAIFITKLFDMMRPGSDVNTGKGSIISKSEYQGRLEEYILDFDDSRDATHYVQRIDDYYGDKTKLAKTILKYMAVVDEWIFITELENAIKSSSKKGFDREAFIDTLHSLVSDHYLDEWKEGGKKVVAWRYKIIKRIYIEREELL